MVGSDSSDWIGVYTCTENMGNEYDIYTCLCLLRLSVLYYPFTTGILGVIWKYVIGSITKVRALMVFTKVEGRNGEPLSYYNNCIVPIINFSTWWLCIV